MEQQKTKKKPRILVWLKRLWSPGRELSIFEEEQVQSPFRTILGNFRRNKLAMGALVLFILIFLTVMIGPIFLPINLGDSDSTQSNVAPGMNIMSVPSELKKDINKISTSSTFGVGIDNSGNVYVWGKTKMSKKTNIKNLPKELKNQKVIDISAGADHVVALTERGTLVAWGYSQNGQTTIPIDLMTISPSDVAQLTAGNQVTALVTREGKLYIWGNLMSYDGEINDAYQGHIKKVALASFGYIALLDDGSVVYPGAKANAFSTIPEELTKGGVVDIVAASMSCAAVLEDGSVVVWGNTTEGESNVPAMDGKIVSIYGGRYHFTALTDKGSVYSWGGNDHKESTVPSSLSGEEVTKIFGGYYQNYAVTESGKLVSWGLKGYLLGTDKLGRDILTRIINGGRMTMTVGGVAVIISTLIGVVLGCLSGYFGGKVDMLVMRIAEIVGGLPFLPFAMILSAVVGTMLSETQRVYLIMVILGVLSWPGICRLVRAQVFSARESEYVVAAKSLGLKERKIVFRHILPNVISIVVVSATLDFATSMLTESSLSYLGFGINPPTPTWGNMLTGANSSIVIQQYWWQWVFTSVIFALCTICINTIGDGLREAIDPKSNGR